MPGEVPTAGRLRTFAGDGAPVGAFILASRRAARPVGASVERTGKAGTVERGALLGPGVAASDGGRNLHGMTGADAVPTWIRAAVHHVPGANVRR